jgi:hypothetical protein
MILTFGLNLIFEELLVVQLQLVEIQAINNTEIKPIIIPAKLNLKMLFQKMIVTSHILVTLQTR